MLFRSALLDLYHVLLHNGSCHEGFENLVEPWSNRDPWPIPPPHAWAAAKTSLFIRNCLVREYGGDAGLDKSERNLYLYSLLSPVWCQEGKHIEIKNAGTEFGQIDSRCSFTNDGAEITINEDFHHQPAEVVIAVPYHKKLIDFTSDAYEQYLEDGYMCFSSDVEKIHIQWKDKPQVYENNYQNILKTYRSERAIAWEADKVKGHEHEDARYKMNQLNAKWVMLPKAKPFLID